MVKKKIKFCLKFRRGLYETDSMSWKTTLPSDKERKNVLLVFHLKFLKLMSVWRTYIIERFKERDENQRKENEEIKKG